MKAGILIDDWKLATFERHLKAAGYQFVNAGAFTPGTLALTVMTENAAALAAVVKAANKEAANVGTRQ